ncbi:MAG: CGGC domain-containing protein [Endomicrobia bacterium]|nr:CGGC domain-containing protein [Endomicrobiia bacterium]
MKIGIIRCMQTEDYCPGTADFRAIKNKTGIFENIKDDIEIIGMINCGGCPGKKITMRAMKMIEKGADTIAMATCINKGSSNNFACPFSEKIMNHLTERLAKDIKILPYTH